MNIRLTLPVENPCLSFFGLYSFGICVLAICLCYQLPSHLLFAENTSACVVTEGGIPYILPPLLKCHKNVTLLLKCASILPLNIASLTVYFCKQDLLDLDRPLTQTTDSTFQPRDQLIQAKKAVEVKVNQMSEIYLILILRGYLLGKARHSLGTQICWKSPIINHFDIKWRKFQHYT